MNKELTTLISDIGGTNCRISLFTKEDGIHKERKLKISKFNSLENLFSEYLKLENIPSPDQGILGVAAPVVGDKVKFINVNLEFSQKKLKNKFFKESLIVMNDLELQALSISKLNKEDMKIFGDKDSLSKKSKILIRPGTGLGLSGLIAGNAIATEAGHLNIPQETEELTYLSSRFSQIYKRSITFEDLLSGKGILFIHKTLSGKELINRTSEEILLDSFDNYCVETKRIFTYTLALFCRYAALMWGAKGGVYLAGSIVNTIFQEVDMVKFREVFEDSTTMKDLLLTCPLVHVKSKNLGFKGALRLLE